MGALIAGEVFLYPRSHGLLFLVTLFRCDDEGGGGGGGVMRGPLDEVGLFSDFLKFFECLKLLDRLSLLLDRNWRSRSSR